MKSKFNIGDLVKIPHNGSCERCENYCLGLIVSLNKDVLTKIHPYAKVLYCGQQRNIWLHDIEKFEHNE